MRKTTVTEREFDDEGHCYKETVTETDSAQTYYPALDSVPTAMPTGSWDCALCLDPKVPSNHRMHEPSWNNQVYREWAMLNYGDDFQRKQRAQHA